VQRRHRAPHSTTIEPPPPALHLHPVASPTCLHGAVHRIMANALCLGWTHDDREH
jgi:hypothetical protein